MTMDARCRKLPDQSEAVGFCLQAAAANSALLTRYEGGASSLRAGLDPVSRSLRNTVSEALKAAAQHVDAFAEILARDVDQQLTAEQEAAEVEAVRTISRELADLAQRAGTQTVPLSEFQSIEGRLMDLDFAIKPHHALDVVAAIMDPDP